MDDNDEGYVSDRDELVDALNETNKCGAFDDIESDATARQSLLKQDGEQGSYRFLTCFLTHSMLKIPRFMQSLLVGD